MGRSNALLPKKLREVGSVEGGGHPVEESCGFLPLCTKTPHGRRWEDIGANERRRR